MKINLSLFVILSFAATSFLHTKSETDNTHAFLSLVIGLVLLSMLFLPIRWLLSHKNQRIFMLSYSGFILWIGIVIGALLLFLRLRNAEIHYYYALVANVVFLMIFLISYTYRLLNQLTHK